MFGSGEEVGDDHRGGGGGGDDGDHQTG